MKQRAVLLSFAEVNCGLPKTGKHVVIDQYLTTKFGNAVNTYHVSVANGNGKFSSPHKYFKVYDSKCMRCTNPKNTCHLKVTSLLIYLKSNVYVNALSVTAWAVVSGNHEILAIRFVACYVFPVILYYR